MSEDDPGERWIIVRNWERFQHYNPELRDPPWIKAYTRLMSDDNYLSLSVNRALILHRLWLEYARSGCELRVNTASLSRRLAVKVTIRDLESLNRAGFIEFSLARPQVTPASDTRPHGEVEKRRTQPQSKARTPLIDREARPEANANGDLSEIGWSVPDYLAAVEGSRQREET